MSKTPELLNCPLCDGAMEKINCPGDYCRHIERNPDCPISHGAYEITKWNTRPTDSRLLRAAKALLAANEELGSHFPYRANSNSASINALTNQLKAEDELCAVITATPAISETEVSKVVFNSAPVEFEIDPSKQQYGSVGEQSATGQEAIEKLRELLEAINKHTNEGFAREKSFEARALLTRAGRGTK